MDWDKVIERIEELLDGMKSYTDASNFMYLVAAGPAKIDALLEKSPDENTRDYLQLAKVYAMVSTRLVKLDV